MKASRWVETKPCDSLEAISFKDDAALRSNCQTLTRCTPIGDRQWWYVACLRRQTVSHSVGCHEVRPAREWLHPSLSLLDWPRHPNPDRDRERSCHSDLTDIFKVGCGRIWTMAGMLRERYDRVELEHFWACLFNRPTRPPVLYKSHEVRIFACSCTSKCLADRKSVV